MLGRNELCHCGSGRKYKRCHLADDAHAQNKTTTVDFKLTGALNAVGLPGAHADAELNLTGQASIGPYTVVFTLGESAAPPGELRLHTDLEGDSNIAFAMPGEHHESERVLDVMLEDGSSQLVYAYPNKSGRLGKLKLLNVCGSSYEEARKKASRFAFDIISNLSLMYDIPFEVFQVDTIDEISQHRNVTLRFQQHRHMECCHGAWRRRAEVVRDVS